jgi:uncharacterized protein YeaO (DUF488 family)
VVLELAEPASPVCYLAEFEDLEQSQPLIRLQRAYEPSAPAEGQRILVDRLWPRGVKRSALKLDAWLKAVAPSNPLRRWFHAEPQKRWAEFQSRYRAELRAQPETLQPLLAAVRQGPVTLVYGARDARQNHAVVLREYLLAELGRKKSMN